ncbi:efflux RND transporter periplasmic adaptor subunit, partial [bacterium]|nr:efflux RND transporter periplasmic adaptor subunit [bacterium]
MSFNANLSPPQLTFSEKAFGLIDRSFLMVTTSARSIGFVGLLIFILISTFFQVAAAASQDSKSGPHPLVTVTSIIEEEINPPAEYVGHVEAIQSVDIQARVKGFLEQVNFKEGSNVQAGDLLYVIEQ